MGQVKIMPKAAAVYEVCPKQTIGIYRCFASADMIAIDQDGTHGGYIQTSSGAVCSGPPGLINLLNSLSQFKLSLHMCATTHPTALLILSPGLAECFIKATQDFQPLSRPIKLIALCAGPYLNIRGHHKSTQQG